MSEVKDEFGRGGGVFEHGDVADSPEQARFCDWLPFVQSGWVHPLVLVANCDENRNRPARNAGCEISILAVPFNGCSRRNVGVMRQAESSMNGAQTVGLASNPGANVRTRDRRIIASVRDLHTRRPSSGADKIRAPTGRLT